MNHGEAVETHAEGVTGELCWIEGVVSATFVDGVENGRVDHAASGDLDPLGCFSFDLKFDVDFKRRLGEGEEVGAETDFGFVPEHSAIKEFEGAFEVGKADVFVHVEPFELVKDGEVGGVDFIATIGGAGGYDFDRRSLLFHRADLDRGGMGAEELAGVEVEGVGVVSRGVISGRVEGVEAVELGFDFRAIGEGEAEASQNLDRTVLDDGERVEGTDGEFAGRHGDVEASNGSGIGCVLEAPLAGIECSGDGLPGGVEGGTEFGFFLVGEVTHFSGEGVEGGFLAEEFDAGIFEGGFGGSGCDGGEGVGLDLCGLLGHVRALVRRKEWGGQ